MRFLKIMVSYARVFQHRRDLLNNPSVIIINSIVIILHLDSG